MAKRNESILELLTQVPWWISVVLSATAFFVLKFIVPAINFQSWVLKGIAGAAPTIAYFVAIILLVHAPISYFNSSRKRKLLDKQKDIDSIKSLSWKQFEELIAEAYRRKGYSVVENYDIGPDGGIDLVLKKDGNMFLVQCKQWRSYKVDVRVVREMYGVMTAKHAAGVIIVTSGLFTQEAKNFAVDKPIDLVEGSQVVNLIRSVQTKLTYSPDEINKPRTTANLCPDCGGELVMRVAQHGKNAGNKFWGCSNFPKCKFSKAYTG